MSLIACNKIQFQNFLKDKNVKEKQGNWFHETFYVDENENVIASMLTSSWSTVVEYKIEADNSNAETVLFLSEKFN